jgi:hypothetical protein
VTTTSALPQRSGGGTKTATGWLGVGEAIVVKGKGVADGKCDAGATSAMPTSAQTNRMIANFGGPNVIDVYGSTAVEKFALDNPAMYAKITALEQFNEEGATKNIAGCACSTWTTGQFDADIPPQALLPIRTPLASSHRRIKLQQPCRW